MQLLHFLTTPEFFNVAMQTVGIFSTIATITPNRVDNQIAQALVNIIHFFGMNFGNAKNSPR